VAGIAIEEAGQGKARSRGPWLLGILGVLVVLGVAAGFVAVYALGIFAPLDRSTPQATATGYFKALSAQDYSRAWQYASISHSDPNSETSFAGGLRADDDHLGRITSVGAAQVAQDSPSSARATVVVQRGGDAGTQMTYTLSMTLYDGTLWLIDSVTVS
jgi:hypothetical protein